MKAVQGQQASTAVAPCMLLLAEGLYILAKTGLGVHLDVGQEGEA